MKSREVLTGQLAPRIDKAATAMIPAGLGLEERLLMHPVLNT